MNVIMWATVSPNISSRHTMNLMEVAVSARKILSYSQETFNRLATVRHNQYPQQVRVDRPSESWYPEFIAQTRYHSKTCSFHSARNGLISGEIPWDNFSGHHSSSTLRRWHPLAHEASRRWWWNKQLSCDKRHRGHISVFGWRENDCHGVQLMQLSALQTAHPQTQTAFCRFHVLLDIHRLCGILCVPSQTD